MIKGGKYSRQRLEFNLFRDFAGSLRFRLNAGSWQMLRACFLLLIFPLGLLAEEAKTSRWPKTYVGKQKLEVKRLDATEAAGWVFETEGFRFYSDVEISNPDWRAIMIVCEGVRGAVGAVPLDLLRPGNVERERGVVKLFGKEDDYRDAGGFPGSVGSFRGRGGEVLIWTRGLIEPDPEQGRFRLKRSQQYDLLVHELCHQALGREFERLPIWFNEGIAEYFAAAQHAPGQYSFRDPATSISNHVKKYLGAVTKGEGFEIVPLKGLVSSGGRAWATDNRDAPGRAPYLKYVSAVLLVHYFCHLDPQRGQGDVVRDFTRALREGDSVSRATVEELLRGRTLEQIEGEMEKFWKERGLRIEFPD